MPTNKPSDFNAFASDYDKVNIIDNPTYQKKKIYEKKYWLVMPSKNFVLNVGETKTFSCFLRTHGEQFGDSIVPVDISSYTFLLRIYDNNDIIVVSANITNTNGELSYDFQKLDFSVSGRYFAEIEITNGETVFSLPTSNSRIEIIVN